MDRYSYERADVTFRAIVVDVGEKADVRREAFLVYDGLVGCSPGQEIAICDDRDDAVIIVAALNCFQK